MTKRGNRRDWQTPVLLTLSLHLLAFTLFVNHRLFALLEPPATVGHVMHVTELVGDDPQTEQQEDDQGAAPGPEAPELAPTVAELLRQATPEQVVLPQREPQTITEVRPEPIPDAAGSLTLAERLAQMVPAAGTPADGGFVAGGGSHGLRGLGRRGEGLRRHGGSAETEDAMEMGLAWLASVQDLDGRWDSDGFMVHYLPGANSYDRGAEGMGLQRNDIGVTGLCLMAFTGAGYVHNTGRFAQTVRRAREYLLTNQRIEDGGFGLERDPGRPDMYGHALATLGLCDLYLQSADQSLRVPLQRALTYLLEMQGPGGGWDYTQRWPSGAQRFEHSGRNDLSITGWAVMALIAAREAGFVVPPENLARLADVLRAATLNDGDAQYADQGVRAGARGAAMLAVSNVSRRLLGEPSDSGIQQRQREKLVRHLPQWAKAGELLGSNEYCWYYGSLAMLLGRDSPGGADRWREWNAALKKTLLDNQCKAGPRRGSFDPVGHWAQNGGGRLYMTALCVLTLQIYYRLEPEYLRVRSSELSGLWE